MGKGSIRMDADLFGGAGVSIAGAALAQSDAITVLPPRVATL
jgi:hypothetical protein